MEIDTIDFDAITPERLKAQAKAQISAALESTGQMVDLREGSYTDILLSEGAYQVYKAYMLARDLLAAAVPSEDGGPHLDRFAAVYGIVRTPGLHSAATVTFSGTDGTRIPANTAVCSDGGLVFLTTEAVTITGGTASCRVVAEKPGAIYDLSAGEICRMQFTLAGVTGVTGGAASGGADEETDRALYARLHDLLSTPVASGNPGHYKQWAREVSGVGYASVVPLWDGPGTVKVLVADEHKLPVSETVRAAVAAHIEEIRPIGADVTVCAVDMLEIHVAATVVLLPDTTVEQVRARMEDKVQQVLLDIPMGEVSSLRYTRIIAALMSCPEVDDYTTLTVNGGTANIPLTAEMVPVLRSVTITAVEG